MSELNLYEQKLSEDLEKALDALEGVRDFARKLEPYAEQGHTLVPALEKACKVYNELTKETELEKTI